MARPYASCAPVQSGFADGACARQQLRYGIVFPMTSDDTGPATATVPSDRLRAARRPLERVVIIGASLAGLRAAETLRQQDFPGEVIVIGAESHRPYDRPPLSKKVLSGEWEPDRIHLRQPDTFDELDVTWELGVAATGLDLDTSVVTLADGRTVGFHGLIIATGAAPKLLADQHLFEHVHVLRTLDDSLAVRAEIVGGGRRVVVIGAGFIGLEVAAIARHLGNDVTVLEGAAAPLIRGLGAEMGAVIGALHEAHGVTIRCNVSVTGLSDTGVRVRDAHGADELVEADVIVVGVGVTPSTAWLDGSGLELHDGIVCDEGLRARTFAPTDSALEPTPLVFAAGDVARWPNRLLGHEMRIEHWTNAAEQGAHAASNLLASAAGEPTEPYAPVPFFWSDQFEHRIQFVGHALAGDEVQVVAGSVADDKFLALFGSSGKFHGALGLNAPRLVMPTRKLLLEQASWAEAIQASTR
jgi:NADPH-dependent 2,4-dienoyl-CoA reductase/sulfur reductase-like enzyme